MIVCVLTAFVCHFVCDILEEILDSLGQRRVTGDTINDRSDPVITRLNLLSVNLCFNYRFVMGHVINFKLKPELILKHFPASDNIKDLFKIMNNFIDVQNFHRKV